MKGWGDPIPLEAVGADHCRWPIAWLADGRQGFCGAQLARAPYCAVHRPLAYRKPFSWERALERIR